MTYRKKPSKEESLQLVRQLRDKLTEKNIPIQQILLFGSVAKGVSHKWSDIDVVVICKPFKATRHEENMEVRKARRDIDLRISPICLHPEDMENKYSTIVQEVKQYGTAV